MNLLGAIFTALLRTNLTLGVGGMAQLLNVVGVLLITRYGGGVNGVLWVLRTGAPWRDLPERYGPWQTVATRFYRWRRTGIWDRILAELKQQADAEGTLDWTLHDVDGTMIRAHQRAAGAQKRG